MKGPFVDLYYARNIIRHASYYPNHDTKLLLLLLSVTAVFFIQPRLRRFRLPALPILFAVISAEHIDDIQTTRQDKTRADKTRQDIDIQTTIAFALANTLRAT